MITLITEPEDYSKKAIRLYRSLGRVYFFPELTPANRRVVEQSTHLLVTGLTHQIDRAWIDAMPKLKAVATNTTGLNHINVEYLKKKGIKLISLRGRTGFLKHIPSTAEATMALLLSLVRNVPLAFNDVKRGAWDRMRWRGHQLKGKMIGLFGCGRLGKIVARYARAFGMSVIAYDPYVSEAAMRSHGVRKVSCGELFRRADVLSLHALLTDETRGTITARHLKCMKPSAYFINTARAELVERGALLAALERKWIAGAAIDVMRDERADGSHLKRDPLWRYAREHENLVIVPHIGGATYEAMATTEEFIAEQVVKHIEEWRSRTAS